MSKGKERLAEPGYYITYYGVAGKMPEHDFGVVHISKERKCKYIHWSWGKAWNTLMWSCAPTKKQIQADKDAHCVEECDRFMYFKTHEDLLKYPFIKNKPGALEKSPLDK